MGRHPEFDPRRRKALLAKIRTERRVALAHALSPAERLQRALGISHLSYLTRSERPPLRRTSDEPPELWRAIKARLRDADERA